MYYVISLYIIYRYIFLLYSDYIPYIRPLCFFLSNFSLPLSKNLNFCDFFTLRLLYNINPENIPFFPFNWIYYILSPLSYRDFNRDRAGLACKI